MKPTSFYWQRQDKPKENRLISIEEFNNFCKKLDEEFIAKHKKNKKKKNAPRA